MDSLLQLFGVFMQHPERIALVSGIFFAIWLPLWNRGGRGRTLRDLALLIPAGAWGLFAIYELAVNLLSPEADIRVDLLLIIPILIVATLAGIVLAVLRRAR